MAGYTRVNVKEVEDQAPRLGFAPDLEARFAREALGLERAGLGYQRFAPGFRMPLGHRHTEQEEIYVVVGGSVRAKLDDEVIELSTWDALRVPGDTMRAFEGGPEGGELIAFGAPLTESIAADVEMTPGW